MDEKLTANEEFGLSEIYGSTIQNIHDMAK